MPCPENLIKKIAINKNGIDKILEKKKQENASNKITKKANLEIFISSIFFPTQNHQKICNIFKIFIYNINQKVGFSDKIKRL